VKGKRIRTSVLILPRRLVYVAAKKELGLEGAAQRIAVRGFVG